MKPNPLSSLNHFTVPVAMCSPSGVCALRYAEGALGNNCGTLGTDLAEQFDRPVARKGSGLARPITKRKPPHTGRDGWTSAPMLRKSIPSREPGLAVLAHHAAQERDDRG